MSQPVCESCGNTLSKDAKFCGICGHPVKKTEKPDDKGQICEKCGSSNPRDSRYCQNCGNQLNVTGQPSQTPSVPTQFQPVPNVNQPSQQFYQQGSPTTFPPAPSFPVIRKEVKGAIYEDMIIPTEDKWIGKYDRKVMIFISSVLVLSLGFKFMLLFDAFPPLFTWIIGTVLMSSFMLFHIIWFRHGLKDYGFSVDFHYSRFDLLASLVLSTFFVSYVGVSIKENKERSTLKESNVILVQNFDQRKFKNQQISRVEYYFRIAYPKVKRDFLVLILIIGFIMNYLAGSLNPEIQVALRLFSNFLAMYVLVEIFPSIGRDKFLMKYLKGWQALTMFLASALLFVFTMGVDVRRSLDVIF